MEIILGFCTQIISRVQVKELVLGWMNLEDSIKKMAKWLSPIIYNVGNFSKPTGDKPALIKR